MIVVVSALVLAATLVGFLYLGVQKSGTQIPSSLIGKPARDFRLKVIQDAAGLAQTSPYYLHSKDLRGKNIILNFWASWCFSCRQEALDLQHLWQSLDQKDTVVVGVAIQDTIAAAQNFAAQYGKTYTLGLDETGSVSIDYGITGVPETFFIDKAGIIRHKEAAPLSFAQLWQIKQKYLP